MTRRLEQSIGFVTADDAVRLAYAWSGSGVPVVKTANWLTHLEFDWQTPVWRHWLDFLSAHCRLLRYDERGNGLSDHDAEDLGFDRWVSDLECLVDTLGLETFTLLGISQGGAVAIEYAVRHPERVRGMVLCGAYAQGWARREDPEQLRLARALLDLVEPGWGADNPAYRQVFTMLFVPDATPEEAAWLNEMQRMSTEPAVAARLIEAAGAIDIRDRLAQVSVPTLVMHVRDDARVPFEQGRRLAAGIPGARFVPLDGRNHALLSHDPGWPVFQREFLEFIGADAGWAGAPPPGDPEESLTPRERTIVALVARGLDNREIAGRLGIAEKTVRNHLTRIFDKLDVRTRAQLIVRARVATPG
jgi:pimeloyl-ACP methyl ester carboxylesterase/DNA-binding CsgD family transcriptional regulator